MAFSQQSLTFLAFIMKKNNQIRHARKSRKWIPVSISIVAVLVYLGIMLNSHTSGQPANLGSDGRLSDASRAPEFTLTDLQGRMVSLADFRGKVVILDFWATWCPPCKREIPGFIGLQKAYASRGVQIVGVGLDEPADIRQFAASHGINYPVLLGNDEVSALYGGISGIPTTFIIDKSGKIVRRFEGFTERSVFEREIESLL